MSDRSNSLSSFPHCMQSDIAGDVRLHQFCGFFPLCVATWGEKPDRELVQSDIARDV